MRAVIIIKSILSIFFYLDGFTASKIISPLNLNIPFTDLVVPKHILLPCLNLKSQAACLDQINPCLSELT